MNIESDLNVLKDNLNQLNSTLTEIKADQKSCFESLSKLILGTIPNSTNLYLFYFYSREFKFILLFLKKILFINCKKTIIEYLKRIALNIQNFKAIRFISLHLDRKTAAVLDSNK